MSIIDFLPLFSIFSIFSNIIFYGLIILGIILAIRYFKKRNSSEIADKNKEKIPRKKASFVAIISTIGVILIALGVAWLLAQNWHYIPSFLKIIILLGLTSLAYVIGVVLREREYSGVGNALITLGALLYTLSVFLIAQIFFTSTGPQGIAWLFLICWVGVLIAGYFLNSRTLLFIAGIEFIIWTFIQSSAFSGDLFSGNSNYKMILIPFFTVTGCVIASVFFSYIYKPSKENLYSLIGIIVSFFIYLIPLAVINKLSLQGVAFVVLLSLIVFIITSYISRSKAEMFMSFLYFLIWLIIQSSAFFEKDNGSFSIVYFLFLFLISGTLFYGAGLLHRAYNHEFSKIFQWFSVFYFLLFTYIISFQALIPFIWEYELKISSYSMLFLSILGLGSLIVFLSGIFISANKKEVSGKEILVVIIIILVLTGLIFLTKLSPNTLGTCYTKSCNDFKDSNFCDSSPQRLNCEWINNQCSVISCGNYLDQATCTSNYDDMLCVWDRRCIKKSCGNFKTPTECGNAPTILGCGWRNNSNYQNNGQCYLQNYNFVQSNAQSIAENTCNTHTNNQEECISQGDCKWNPSRSSRLRKPGEVSFNLWLGWIIINIFFVILILAAIGYGSLEKFLEIINLGIAFFVLDIITRYIGFIMSFWGYTSLAVIFITGGIILIVGGWLITRWRKKLIIKAEGEQNLQENIKKKQNEKKLS
jgi:uncharacterized membrane protein